MGKLSHIVDSLNLKYKTCNFNATFYSNSQTSGHLIKVDSASIKAALVDMENQIPMEDFVKKYPKVKLIIEELNTDDIILKLKNGN